MAVGYTSFIATALLNYMGNATAMPAITNCYMKLHLTTPGAAGAGGAAANTTRQLVGFGTAAAGAMANDTAITWTAVSTTETYLFFSLWDASTGGNCVWTGNVTGGAVTAGNDFTIAIGSLTLSMTVAS